jgi:hypothetical protein
MVSARSSVRRKADVTELHLASFNDIVAELRRRYPVTIIAVQHALDGKPGQTGTRICHHSHDIGGITTKLGLIRAADHVITQSLMNLSAEVGDDLPLDGPGAPPSDA